MGPENNGSARLQQNVIFSTNWIRVQSRICCFSISADFSSSIGARNDLFNFDKTLNCFFFLLSSILDPFVFTVFLDGSAAFLYIFWVLKSLYFERRLVRPSVHPSVRTTKNKAQQANDASLSEEIGFSLNHPYLSCSTIHHYLVLSTYISIHSIISQMTFLPFFNNFHCFGKFEKKWLRTDGRTRRTDRRTDIPSYI